jgi:hypothetical protein
MRLEKIGFPRSGTYATELEVSILLSEELATGSVTDPD